MSYKPSEKFNLLDDTGVIPMVLAAMLVHARDNGTVSLSITASKRGYTISMRLRKYSASVTFEKLADFSESRERCFAALEENIRRKTHAILSGEIHNITNNITKP